MPACSTYRLQLKYQRSMTACPYASNGRRPTLLGAPTTGPGKYDLNVRYLSDGSISPFVFSMHAMYFHEVPILHPPNFPPPANDRDASATEKGPPLTMNSYISCTFTALCGFWPIVQEIAAVRHSPKGGRLSQDISLAFAESRFQKLLDWSDTLSTEMAPREDSPNHVLLFQ